MTNPAELTFRIPARQRRNVIIITVLSFLLVLGVMVYVPLTAKGSHGSEAAYWELTGSALGLVAVILLYVNVMYGGAYTKCTPAGIRTRGWGRPHTYAWDQVRAIVVVRKANYLSSTVEYVLQVTTVQGRRFTLGAPVSANLNKDPEFVHKYNQIVTYHRQMIGAPGG